MNIKLATLAALLLTPGQAMAEDIRVDCAPDQRIVCRDDETTCYAAGRELATYHFTFDLTGEYWCVFTPLVLKPGKKRAADSAFAESGQGRRARRVSIKSNSRRAQDGNDRGISRQYTNQAPESGRVPG